jgi:hypothetical protein
MLYIRMFSFARRTYWYCYGLDIQYRSPKLTSTPSLTLLLLTNTVDARIIPITVIVIRHILYYYGYIFDKLPEFQKK